jgi:magnesium transporter
MTYERLAHAIREGAAPGGLEALRTFVNAEHPADLARFLDDLNPDQVWAVLDLLPLQDQAELFGYLHPDMQVELAECAPRGKLARVVTEMNSDERADLFNELSDEQQAALLPALAQAEREDIRRMAGYAEGTAGAIMTSDYATLTEDLSATQALQKLRQEAPDKETIYRAYVIDADRRLVGSVRLQDLILAPARASVRDIMEHNTHAVPVSEDQESAARRLARYDLLALPVVDGDGRLDVRIGPLVEGGSERILQGLELPGGTSLRNLANDIKITRESSGSGEGESEFLTVVIDS